MIPAAAAALVVLCLFFCVSCSRVEKDAGESENTTADTNVTTVVTTKETPAYEPETPEKGGTLSIHYNVPGGQKIVTQTIDDAEYLMLPGSAKLDHLRLQTGTGSAVTVKTTKYYYQNASHRISVPSDDYVDYASLFKTMPEDGVFPLIFTSESGEKRTVNLMFSSDIAQVYLTIDESKGTIEAMNGSADHSVYCYGSGVSVDKKGNASDLGTFSMKGRANASWKGSKKPYIVKFESKVDMFGMGKNKKWVLNSNKETTFLRVGIVTDFSKSIDMCTMDYEFADVYMNGRYIGDYYVMESIDISEKKVNITDLEGQIDDLLGYYNKRLGTAYEDLTSLVNNEKSGLSFSEDYSQVLYKDGAVALDLTSGYLLEYDNYTGPYQVALNYAQNKGIAHITIQSPQNLGKNTSATGYTYIRKKIDDWDRMIVKGDRAVLETLDLPSLAGLWTVKEFSVEYNTNEFWVHVENGKMYGGPTWDFDNTFGSSSTYNDPKLRCMESYMHRSDIYGLWLTKLMAFPEFIDEIKKIYSDHTDLFKNETYVDLTDKLYEKWSDSIRMSNKLHGVKESKYLSEVERLKTFLVDRATYYRKYMKTIKVFVTDK